MPSCVTILCLLRELELKISIFFIFFLFLSSYVTCNFDILIIFIYFILLHTSLYFTYLVSQVMNYQVMNRAFKLVINSRNILFLKYEIVSNCASSSAIMAYSRVSYLILLKQLLSNAEEILSKATYNILNRTRTFLDSSISKIPAWQVKDSDSNSAQQPDRPNIFLPT